jgi:D-sedoheptulose 7-phosphate isomerase
MAQMVELQTLYPFLPGGAAAADREGVLAALSVSAERKAAEVVGLRRAMVEAHSARLSACAKVLAGGGRVFAFGNGGSSCDAQQVATLFLNPPRGRPVPALSLTNDVALLTALGNDVGFELVFARQLAALGQAGDVAFGLSASGGSPNVVEGLRQAKRLGMHTVGLAGYDGGAMAAPGLVDFLFVVPSSSIHRIQEVQTTVYHLLWELTQMEVASHDDQDR